MFYTLFHFKLIQKNKIRNFIFLLILIFDTTTQAQINTAPWNVSQLLDTEVFASWIGDGTAEINLILSVGSDALIKHSVDIGTLT